MRKNKDEIRELSRNEMWRSTVAEAMSNSIFDPLAVISTASVVSFPARTSLEFIGINGPWVELEPETCPWCRSEFVRDRRGNCSACGGPRRG